MAFPETDVPVAVPEVIVSVAVPEVDVPVAVLKVDVPVAVSEKGQRGETEMLKEYAEEIKDLKKELKEQEQHREQLKLEYQQKMEVSTIMILRIMQVRVDTVLKIVSKVWGS